MITKAVHYAYPTSPMAAEMKRYGTGCYYVRIDDDATGTTISEPFDTIEAAENHAEKQPGRWARWYVSTPIAGSRFYLRLCRWAATSEGRATQWQAACAKHEIDRPAAKYLHQSTDAAPALKFSNAPCRVCGVKIRPRWAWSETFRREYTQTIRDQGKRSPNGEMAQAAAYKRWYRETHGREWSPIPVHAVSTRAAA
jgi:hypothetical protein